MVLICNRICAHMVSAPDVMYCWGNKMRERILWNCIYALFFYLKLILHYYNNLPRRFYSLKNVQTIVLLPVCWKILKTFSAVTLLEKISSLQGKPLKLYTNTIIERLCILSHSSFLKYLLLWNSRTQNCENHTKESVSSIGDKRLGDSNPWEHEIVIRSTRSSVINCL